MQMAGNDEHRSSARQQAMAAVDSALAAGKGLDLSLPVGYRACSAQVPEQLVCDATDLELPGGLQPESARLGVSVERVAPAAARMPRLGRQVPAALSFTGWQSTKCVVFMMVPTSIWAGRRSPRACW